MMSSRLLDTAGAMATTTSDVDYGYAPMQSSYVGSFEPPGMAMPSGDRPPLLLHHQHSLYDSLDFAAAAFPFQEPEAALFSTGSPPSSLLQHQNFGAPQQITMPMTLSSSSLQAPMMMLPGVPTAEAPDVYTFGGGSGGGYVKREDGPFGDVGGAGRIGLNLGRRTYFSPGDVLAVDRLLMRSRLGGAGAIGPLGLGLGFAHHHQPPQCQAEGCKADLSAAKHYHRRHKVCEYHAKAAAVAAAGKQQRFCQQCSRFHVLGEFDEAKRSCRKRLREHNRRRRKPAGAQSKDSPPPPPPKKADTAGVTSSYTSDRNHKTASRSAAPISPTGGAGASGDGFGCSLIQQQEQLDSDVGIGQASSCSNAATALSLLAGAPPHDMDDGAGGLDTMLMRQRHVLREGRDDHDHHHDQQQHLHMMTSLVQSTHRRGIILSCSPVSTTDQQHSTMSCGDGDATGMQHFFEVDFM